MPYRDDKPKCIICGASTRTQLNPKCNTCDSICTRAKKAGRTREEQLKVDTQEALKKIDEEEQYKLGEQRMYEETVGEPFNKEV